MDNQRILEDNQHLIERTRKVLRMCWIMSLFLVSLAILSIMAIVNGYSKNEGANFFLGIIFFTGFIIGLFYFSRGTGKSRCEIDYLTKEINEIKKTRSIPQDWKRIR